MSDKNFIKALSLCMVFLFCIVGSISVKAAEIEFTTVEIFPEDEVKSIQERVSKLPLFQDKDESGEFSSIAIRTSDYYPTRKGVILVTDDKYKGLIPTGHAAIIYSKDEVVEALSDGVVTGKNDWNVSKNTCYGLSVKDTSIAEDIYAADWCYNQLGKPYNPYFYNISTRYRFYCSQLVWAAFYDNFDIDLSTSDFGDAIHPSELVDSSNTRIIYKK